MTTAENSLEKLTKIRISGYIQAQWNHFENPAIYPSNAFIIRRARFKMKYQPYSGVAFVLEPNFSPKSVSLKTAYARLNEPWLNTFSLWAGLFKKLNYEVETSSSSLDVLTRSMVINALYPSETGLGIKIGITPPINPFQLELALFNGNEHLKIYDAEGEDINPQNNDFDNYKDLMARFVYHFRLGNVGSLDVGASGYVGWLKSNATYLLHGDYTLNKQVSLGQSIFRGWYGVELRTYFDFWGGLALKAEYLRGSNAFPGYQGINIYTDPANIFLSGDTLFINNITTNNTQIAPTIERPFQGWYVYLIKNIGKKNKFAIRWDYYDPNSSLKGAQLGLVSFDQNQNDEQVQSDISGTNPVIEVNNITKTETTNQLKSGLIDLAYHRITACWSYYVTDNITIQLAYAIPINEKVAKDAAGNGNIRKVYSINGEQIVNDYSRIFPQNIFTLQIQAKF